MHSESLRAAVPGDSTEGQIQALRSPIHLFIYLLIASSAEHSFHPFHSIRCTEIDVYRESFYVFIHLFY